MFNGEAEGGDYYASLEHTDKFLEGLFDVLSRTGHLKNTIIIGSSDHGEDPFKLRYARLAAWNSNILHAASYMYYPNRFMANAGVGQRLKRNTQQLTSTLDMHSTLRSILHSADGKYKDYPMFDPTAAAAEGCIAGVDLTTVDVPDDRVVLSLNLASKTVRSGELWAISTRDATLYRRKATKVLKHMGQGIDNHYVLLHGKCTSSANTGLCMVPLDKTWKEHFCRAIVSLRHGSGFVGEEVKQSELVQFFVEAVGGESAVETTEKMIMKDSVAPERMGRGSVLETMADIIPIDVPIDSPYVFASSPARDPSVEMVPGIVTTIDAPYHFAPSSNHT